MSLVGLSVYEFYAEQADVLLARDGEIIETLSSPTATTLYLPQGGNWIRAQDWNNKSFLVKSDQSLQVDVLNSEDGGSTFQVVQGLTIGPASYQLNKWNNITTTMNLNMVQLRVLTQAAAPTSVVLVVRFR